MCLIMKFFLVALFVVIPFLSFSQGFNVMIGNAEFPTDKVPEHVSLPDKVKKLRIKKNQADKAPKTYTVQIGEEEHTFIGDGTYHDVEFSHDIRGLVVSILDEKRQVQGKPFLIRKSK